MRWAPPFFLVSFLLREAPFLYLVFIIKMPVQDIMSLSEVKNFYLTFYFVAKSLTSAFLSDILITKRGGEKMPRAKVYTEQRSRIYFRINERKYNAAVQRSEELGYPTFNKYLEHLLDDDLLIKSIEQRQALLADAKRETK